jgi:hypothetical protein
MSTRTDTRIGKPTKFSGKREPSILKSFVSACRRYFRHTPDTLTDYEKSDLLEEFLEGEAETWYGTVKYTLEEDIFLHIDAIEREFMPPNVEDKARNKLKKQKIGKSYTTYLNKFTKYKALIPSLTEPEAYEYFCSGLTGDFLKDVCRDGCKTLIDAMNTCSRTEQYTEQVAAIISGRQTPENIQTAIDRMEVDAVSFKRKSKEKSIENKRISVNLENIPTAILGRWIKEKRCLRCGEEGHRYSKCTNPEKHFGKE